VSPLRPHKKHTTPTPNTMSRTFSNKFSPPTKSANQQNQLTKPAQQHKPQRKPRAQTKPPRHTPDPPQIRPRYGLDIVAHIALITLLIKSKRPLIHIYCLSFVGTMPPQRTPSRTLTLNYTSRLICLTPGF
jgi:hypothetical protein